MANICALNRRNDSYTDFYLSLLFFLFRSLEKYLERVGSEGHDSFVFIEIAFFFFVIFSFLWRPPLPDSCYVSLQKFEVRRFDVQIARTREFTINPNYIFTEHVR